MALRASGHQLLRQASAHVGTRFSLVSSLHSYPEAGDEAGTTSFSKLPQNLNLVRGRGNL